MIRLNNCWPAGRGLEEQDLLRLALADALTESHCSAATQIRVSDSMHHAAGVVSSAGIPSGLVASNTTFGRAKQVPGTM